MVSYTDIYCDIYWLYNWIYLVKNGIPGSFILIILRVGNDTPYKMPNAGDINAPHGVMDQIARSLCITPEAMPQRPTKKQRNPTGISMWQDPANRMRRQNPNLIVVDSGR